MLTIDRDDIVETIDGRHGTTIQIEVHNFERYLRNNGILVFAEEDSAELFLSELLTPAQVRVADRLQRMEAAGNAPPLCIHCRPLWSRPHAIVLLEGLNCSRCGTQFMQWIAAQREEIRQAMIQDVRTERQKEEEYRHERISERITTS